MTDPDTPIPVVSITAADVAQRVGGTVHGDGARPIQGIATLDHAQPTDLTWVARPDLLPKLATSRAGVALIPRGAAANQPLTLIEVDDPGIALCTVLAYLAPPTETVPPGVHPTATLAQDAIVDGAGIGPNTYVGSGACVEPGTQLHANVWIGRNVHIGRDCVLWPGVVIREHSILGNRVTIHPNAVLGADGFGYHQRDGRNVKIPQIGRVIIEDDVEIGAGTCIDRARSGITRIGRGTKIDNLVQIGHNVTIGENSIIVAQCGLAGSVTVGPHVMLAGQVGVVDHVHIGGRTIVAAKSVVEKDFPDGNLVLRGTPAVQHAAFKRQFAAVRRLPQMVETLRELTKRVAKLESTKDHTERR